MKDKLNQIEYDFPALNWIQDQVKPIVKAKLEEGTDNMAFVIASDCPFHDPDEIET